MKKIFIFLSVFAIIICSCCFSVSAESVDYNDTYPNVKGWKYVYYCDVYDGLTDSSFYRIALYTDNSQVEDFNFFNNNVRARFYINSSRIWTFSIQNNTSSGFVKVHYFNNGQWNEMNSHSGNSVFDISIVMADFSNPIIKRTDFAVYNEDFTEVLYDKPSPPLSLKDSIHKALSNSLDKLSSSVGIIVFCAVGCLALIVLLSLIPRIIHKFL